MLYCVKNLLLLFGFSLLFSCGNSDGNPEVPVEGILTKEKMAGVLTDLTLMQSAIDMNNVRQGLADSTVKFNIYKQHNVSRPQYEANLNYYSKHPEEFQEVYRLVVIKLEAMKKER